MQNQQFNEDQRELEAHFAERVQAYIELGETPEQAAISARQKFGETESVLRELRYQKALRSPITWGLISAGLYLVTIATTRAAWTPMSFFFFYALYLWKTTPRKAAMG